MSDRRCETCGNLTPARCIDCIVDLTGQGEIVMQNWTPRQDDQAECRSPALNEPLKPIREYLAEFAHSQWTGWMEYLFSKCVLNHDGTMTIPTWAVDRWHKQIETKYDDLEESEKDSDRDEADRFIEVLNRRAFPDLSKDFETIENAINFASKFANALHGIEWKKAIKRIEKAIKGE
jgi:hypothetical protein